MDFFDLFLRFLMLKIQFKNAKSGLNLHGTHVDATWHLGPRGSATRAHTAPTWRNIYLYSYSFIIYIGISAFRISEGYSTS